MNPFTHDFHTEKCIKTITKDVVVYKIIPIKYTYSSFEYIVSYELTISGEKWKTMEKNMKRVCE